jgi:tetratricopeptide (TPR) repeat protein
VLVINSIGWQRGIAGLVRLLILASLSACTVSQQQVENSATAQLTVPVVKARAKKALDAGQFPEAAHWYELALQRTDDEVLAREATMFGYEHAQWRSAIRCAERWLTINPTNQDAHEIAAFASIRLYQVDNAVSHLDALLSTAYISPSSGFLQLLPRVQVLDAGAALAVMRKLADKYPDVAEAQYVVAKLASQNANQQLMQAAAERAQQLSPYWSPAGMLLAHAQMAAGNPDLALSTAKAVIANDQSIATRVEYAELLIEAGKLPDAVALLKDADKSQDSDDAIMLLAQIEVQTGDVQAAFDHFTRLLDSSTHGSEANYAVAQIVERAGAVDNARQWYARVQEGEFALPAQIRLAQLIQKQDGIDAALASLKQYGDANSDKQLEMIRARAELLIANNDYAKAMQLYDQSIALYPDDVPLKLARAFLLVKMNKVDAAVNAMQALLDERPDDPIVLNALGYTLVDSTSNVRKGQAYIQRAFQYSPDSGAVLDSMGWAEYKSGHYTAALDYIQRAMKRTLDADLDFHLGEVLWAMKQYDEAVIAWQVGLKHAPKHALLNQRMQMAAKQHKVPVAPAPTPAK